MSPKSVLVTGANRGIGLEFVRQLVAVTPAVRHIIATCRQPDAAIELQKVAAGKSNVHILPFEVTAYDSYPGLVTRVGEIVAEDGLDLLINNAGILIRSELDSVTPEEMIKNFEVNTVTPLMIAKSLLPLLTAAATGAGLDGRRRTIVAMVSSKIASIDDNTSGGRYPYRASKTALNMVSKSLSVDLAGRGISVAIFHPGWVQTDMGGPNALINTQTSIAGMLETLINKPIDEVNGKFLNYDGKVIPW